MHVPGAAGEVAQQQQRRRSAQWPSSRTTTSGVRLLDRGEEVGDRAVQPVALGVRVGLDRDGETADALGQLGQQPRELAAALAQLRAQDRRVGRPHELVQSLHERAVRALDDRVAGPVEHERPRGVGVLDELADQAALAGTRLATHEREAQPLAARRRDQLAQRRELARAAGERERRRQAERTWESGHGRAGADSQV